MNIDVVTEVGDIVDNEMCVFKRGVCTTHNIKGNKMTVNTKKWKKKKYGYGWVTAQQRRLNLYNNGECVRACVCAYVTNFFCRF